MKNNNNFDIKIDNCKEKNILEVEKFVDELKLHLESKFPDFSEKVSMLVTNNVHKILLDKVHIGLINTFLEVEKNNINAYEIYLNANKSGIKLSAKNVKNFITGIIGDYEIKKKNTLNFHEYLKIILNELKS